MAEQKKLVRQPHIDRDKDFQTNGVVVLHDMENLTIQQQVSVVSYQAQMDARMVSKGVAVGDYFGYAGLDPSKHDEYQRKYELLTQAEELREMAKKVQKMASGKHAFDESHRAAVEKMITHFNEADIESRYASIRQVNQAIRVYNDHFPELPHIPLVLNEEQQKTADEFLSKIQNANFKAPESEQVLRDAIESYQALSQDKDNLAIQQYVFPQLQQAYDTYTSISNLSAESKESIQTAFESLDTNFPDSKEMNREALRHFGEIAGAQVIQNQIDTYAPATITPEQLQQLVIEYSQAEPKVKQKLYDDMATLTYHAIEAQPGMQWGSVQTDLYEAYERSFESAPQRVRDFVEECHNMSIDYDNAQERLDAIAKTYGAMTPDEQASVCGAMSELIDKVEAKEPIKTVTVVPSEEKKIDLSQIPGIIEFDKLSAEKQKEYIDMALEHFKPQGTVKDQLNEQLAYLRNNHPEAYAEIKEKIIGNNFKTWRDGEFIANSTQAASAYFEQVKTIAAQHGIDLGGEYSELQRIKAEAEKNNGTYDMSSLSTIRDYILNEYQKAAQMEREIAIEEARKEHAERLQRLQQQMDDGKVLLSVMAFAHNMESSSAKSIPTGLDYIDKKWDLMNDEQRSFLTVRYVDQLKLMHASATSENSGIYITGTQKNGDSIDFVHLKIDSMIDSQHLICLNDKNERVLVLSDTPLSEQILGRNEITSIVDGKPIIMPKEFDSAVSFSLKDQTLTVDIPTSISGKLDAEYSVAKNTDGNIVGTQSYEVLSIREENNRSIMLLQNAETSETISVSSALSKHSIEQQVGMAFSLSNDGQSISFTQKESIENDMVSYSIMRREVAAVSAYLQTHNDSSLTINAESIAVTTESFSRNDSNQLVINHDGQSFVVDKLNSLPNNLAVSAVSPKGETQIFFLDGPPKQHRDDLANILQTGVKEIAVDGESPIITWTPTDGSDTRTSLNKNDLSITYRDGRELVTGYIQGFTPNSDGNTKITALDLESGQITILQTQIPYQDAWNAYGQALHVGLEEKVATIEQVSFTRNNDRIVLESEGKQYDILSMTHTTAGCQITAAYHETAIKFNFAAEEYDSIIQQIQATQSTFVKYPEHPSEKEPLETVVVSDKNSISNVATMFADNNGEIPSNVKFLHVNLDNSNNSVDIQMSVVDGGQRTAYQIQNLSYQEFHNFISNSKILDNAPESIQSAFTEPGELNSKNLQLICSHINGQQTCEMSAIHANVEPGDLVRVALGEKNLGTKKEPDIHVVLRGTAYDKSEITVIDPQFVKGIDGGLYVYGTGQSDNECFRVFSVKFGEFDKIQESILQKESELTLNSCAKSIDSVYTSYPVLDRNQTVYDPITQQDRLPKTIQEVFAEEVRISVKTMDDQVEYFNGNRNSIVSSEFGFIATPNEKTGEREITYFHPDILREQSRAELKFLELEEIPTNKTRAIADGFICVDYANGIAIKDNGDIFRMREQDIETAFVDIKNSTKVFEYPSFGNTAEISMTYLPKLSAAELPTSESDAQNKSFIVVDLTNGIAIKRNEEGAGICYSISPQEIQLAKENNCLHTFVDTTDKAVSKIDTPEFITPEMFDGSKKREYEIVAQEWAICGNPPRLSANETNNQAAQQLSMYGAEIQSVQMYAEFGKQSEIIVTLKEPIINDDLEVAHVRLACPTHQQLEVMEAATADIEGGPIVRLEAYFAHVNECCKDKIQEQEVQVGANTSPELKVGSYCMVHDPNSNTGLIYEVIDAQGTMMAVGPLKDSDEHPLIYRNGQAGDLAITIIEPDQNISKYINHVAQQGLSVYAEQTSDKTVRIGELDLSQDEDGNRHVNGLTVSAKLEAYNEIEAAKANENEKDQDKDTAIEMY